MALLDGDEFVSGSIYSFQQANRMKDHWVRSDPTNVANLSAPQPGMIVVDADAPYRVWVRTSAPAWSEIIHGDPAVGVSFFSAAGAAENPYARIYGYVTAGGAARYVELLVDDTNDEALIQAENNANLEGITVSLPEANQEFRIRGAGGAERFHIDQTGIFGYMRQGELFQWTYQGDLDDDASFNLPAFTDACWGFVQAGNNEEYALFSVDDDGDVTLILNSANVVANADTDAKLVLGTAATQEPLVVRNRLGVTKNINLIIWYS